MRYLVLGSSGQIGSALYNYYLTKNQEVESFDIVDNINQDLRKKDNQILQEKLDRCDFVFFLAFDVGGSKYLKKYQQSFDFLQNNIQIMENTFNLLRITKKPFIFASSQMSNMDYSSYGTLKRIGEYYTEALGGLVVKFWNVYGLETDLQKSHVITDFILQAKNNGSINMLTDGTEVRQFLYSQDCCEALDIVCDNYNLIDSKQELHIASGKWYSIIEVAQHIAKIFNVKVIAGHTTDLIQRGGKANEPDPYLLKFWKPTTSLQNGIRKICNHYV